LGEFKSGVFIRRTGIKIVLQEEFEVFEFRRDWDPCNFSYWLPLIFL